MIGDDVSEPEGEADVVVLKYGPGRSGLARLYMATEPTIRRTWLLYETIILRVRIGWDAWAYMGLEQAISAHLYGALIQRAEQTSSESL